MTILIGVLCHDGVVIGADNSATLAAGQLPTVEQPYAHKIDVIDQQVIVAHTGSIGLAQRFTAVVDTVWKDPAFQQVSYLEIGKHLAKTGREDFAATYVQNPNYGALVAFPWRGRAYLCVFEPISLQPEFKTAGSWYVALGSGQLLTDSFLAFIRWVYWEEGPPVCQDAIWAVTLALEHAITCNPGGISGPMHLAVLTTDTQGQLSARSLETAEIAEHRENVQGLVTAMRAYPRLLQGKADAPDIPRLDP